MRFIGAGALFLAATLAACGSGSSKGTYTLSLTSFTFHINQTIFLKVKENGTTMAQTQGVVSPQATLVLTVQNVLENGKVYNVDFFADSDGNGSYAPPSGGTFPEHSWRRQVTG